MSTDDAALQASTDEDRQHYLETGLRPLDCQHCGNRVRVKKNSFQHTSIQWSSDGPGGCPMLRALVADGEHPARVGSCEYLRASIDGAVHDGTLEVRTWDVEPE
jgi:hypothetical protein